MRALGHQGRIDANQVEIVAALRQAGVSVMSLARIGGGAPDLLLARAGKMYLVEVKTDGGTLAQSQLDWIAAWNAPVVTVRSIEGALFTVGILKHHDRVINGVELR
jgi:VRR-NUC domain